MERIHIYFTGDPSMAPLYGSSESAGADLKACLDQSLTVPPGERVLIPTGISLEIPQGYEGQIRPRSGLAWKKGISMVNSPGTIDSDYRGEIKIILINHGKEDFIVEPAMRIAQLVICPVHQAEFSWVETIGNTDRGAGGFGSTGTA